MLSPRVHAENDTKRLIRGTENAKITVVRTEKGQIKKVTLQCSMNYPQCQQGFAITSTAVFEIWWRGVGKQTLIHKVLFC